jgi:squalene synthase HpnC
MMHAALLELSRSELPSAQAVMDRAHGENFPVAARVLSRTDRRHLLAVYGFARLTDELGDELQGDRLAALDWLESELDRAYAGQARHPLLMRLQETIAECALPREPLLGLIEANRLDQRQTRYETWEQLQAYCELSANPVGELVLCVFRLATPERITLSNSVCTGLQLTEHLQDVAEDLRRGRIYLPEEDLAGFGCSHEQLASLVADGVRDLDIDGDLARSSGAAYGSRDSARQRLRSAIEFEVARARQLLSEGVPLVASVSGRPKLALAAFVGGGRAALGEIERADFEVLGGVRAASRRRRVRALAGVLAESRA